MATRGRLLQLRSLLAQQALRAAPKPRPQPTPHRLLHSSPPLPSAASPSPSSRLLLWRSSGSAGSLLPMSAVAVAAAARAAAARWLAARGAGSLQLFSLQRRTASKGLLSAASTLLRRAPWANWLPSPDGTVLMLVSANVAVFMLWRLADPDFMKRNFTISLDNFKSGRLHTLITSAFSHAEPSYLISNMIGIYFFGANISNQFGPAFLLNLYIAGALAGSAFFLLDKAFLAPRKQVFGEWDSSRALGLGASAAGNAIILLQVFLHPKRLVYLYFFIPIPAAILGAVLIGSDLLRVNKGQGHVSGSYHLGGALVAALTWARIRKGWI